MRGSGQPMARSCLVRGGWTALWAGTALLALSAAAPRKPAPPPSASLFQPFAIQPENLAVLTAGASMAPASGPWCACSALVAGAHPDIQVWNLRGPMSTKSGRIQVGAGSLFLAGFGPPAAAPLAELATLKAGDDRGCWELVNTEVVRPFPPALLEDGRIRDRNGIFNGDMEVEAFTHVLILAQYTSARAFAKAARNDLGYANLFNEPQHYRGQVVHITGRLIKLLRFDPPDEARGAGVSNLYEGWVMTDDFGENPVCIVFTDLPPGLKIDNRRRLNVRVDFDGYFYKRYRYKALDSKKSNEFRDAPLVIGHSPVGRFGPSEMEGGEAAESWGHGLIWLFLGAIGAAVLLVVVLTTWFRYNDRRIRRRIRAARPAEFIPPADEDRFAS